MERGDINQFGNNHSNIAERPFDTVVELTVPTYSESVAGLSQLPIGEYEQIYQYFKNEFVAKGVFRPYLVGRKITPPLATLKGFAWEYLSFLYVKDKLPESNILLSPRQTNEIFLNISTEESRKNTTIPDGILLGLHNNQTFLFGVAEYKSSQQLVKYNYTQYNKYLNGKVFARIADFLDDSTNAIFFQNYLKKKYPDLPPFTNFKIGNPQFLFVGPKGRDYNSLQDVNDIFFDLPITRDNFDFISRNLRDYLSNTRNTI